MRKGIVTNKWFLMTVILIAVIIIIATSFKVITRKEEALTADIGADPSTGRIGQNIQFSSVNSTGNIESYHWLFGDGNESTLEDPSHTYTKPRLFNVTLDVIGTNGKTARTTHSIGIQRIDFDKEESYGRVININPFVTYRYSFQDDIGPYNGNPSISTECSIINGLGEFEFSVEIWIWDENDDLIEVLFLYSTTYTGRNSEIVFNFDIVPNDMDPLIVKNRSVLYLTLRNIQGTWDDAIIKGQVIYPMD